MNSSKFQSCLSIDELTYERLKEVLIQLIEEAGLSERSVRISARTLTPVEAIGDPERRDFPLVKGREVMLEATLDQAIGQAFTDMPAEYSGPLKEVSRLSLSDNAERGIFIATLNAVFRLMGWIDRTIHCKNEEPEECAKNLPEYIKSCQSDPKIAFIGFQPAMVDNLSRSFPIRVTDIDPDNVGQEKYGLIIESVDKTPEIIDWSNIVLATGSTLVNNTYRSLLRNKPIIFYGVTVTAIAYITGCGHYCFCGK